VPQFLLDEAVAAGRGAAVSIVCTQPRRVAAISVAERVARERGEQLGRSVGFQVYFLYFVFRIFQSVFQVRMEHKLPRLQGSVLYCTAGILLQRMASDRGLKQFTHVVLDEVHERDVMADLILAILKQELPRRPDLRVVLMSATLNADQFSAYMGDCPALHIPGFMHPVEPHYLEHVLQMTGYNVEEGTRYDEEKEARPGAPRVEERSLLTPGLVEQLRQEQGLSPGTAASLLHPKAEQLNVDLVATLVSHIHATQPPGAVLVFLPGWEEISSLSSLLTSAFILPNVTVLPLHGSMSPTDQRLIFEKTAPGNRKIVIATNIAESSVTIDDVVYVVDCGRAKMKMFDPVRNFATLRPEWISRANARQRMGRAGRLLVSSYL
jgi:ATP-dependent RNA helicase DHX36